LIKALLSHQWKSFWRSRSAGKNLAVQIFMAFITLYFLAVSIGVGFFLVELIKKLFPGQEVVKVFCGFILYYFCFDIITRFMMQDLPTLAVQPYLILNIRRSKLIGFLNFRSLFSPLNLLPLFIFFPFIIMVIGRNYGLAAAVSLIISIIFLTISNHFFISWIKRKTVLNSWWLVGFFLAVAGFLTADYFQLFSLSKLSEVVFLNMLRWPWLSLVTVILAVAAFINNYRFLYNNLYLEDIIGKVKRRQSANYHFLERFGTAGELISVDIKLLTRNKRPRTLLLLSLMFALYGFIFYKERHIHDNSWGILLFGGIFLTGMFISNYGQFLFAWQSSHFDGLMAGHVQVRTYIRSKFMVFTAVSTILFLLVSFYGLISWKLLVVQLAGYFFNIGIHTVLAVYFATRSYKGVDISKRSAFNMQGLSGAQWIYSLVILIIPVTLYLPLALLVSPLAGVAAVGITGLVSFLLQDRWTDLLTKEFMKRKHTILEGFREK
jgi:hypothetical protein